MRHRVGHRKLGRVTEHRIALLRNQAEALLTHEHITTTVPKAKELRPFVEKLITTAKRGVRAADPKGVTLSARRLVMRHVVDQDVVAKLFDELAPRFMERPGGYTRILKLGYRRGDGRRDGADRAGRIRVRPQEGGGREGRGGETGDQPKSQKSVGERLRSAASRIRGEKKDKGAAPSKASQPARRAPKKSTTPRKAGGS